MHSARGWPRAARPSSWLPPWRDPPERASQHRAAARRAPDELPRPHQSGRGSATRWRRSCAPRARRSPRSTRTSAWWSAYAPTTPTSASSAAAIAGVEGVAADRVIGRAPGERHGPVEQENLRAAKAGPRSPTAPGRRAEQAAKASKAGDPLDGNLWGMRMIRADQAHTRTLGNRQGQGRDHGHRRPGRPPRHHANFDYRASRNFATTSPTTRRATSWTAVRGRRTAASTRSAPTTAATARTSPARSRRPRTASGSAASPRRPASSRCAAGQDSGYFFAGPTVNALTYSGDAGLDVVNMSFYVDPWLYNCQGGARRTPRSRPATRTSSSRPCTRALELRAPKGVTLVAAAGNEHHDLANPGDGRHQPGLPGGHDAPAHDRQRNVPTCRPRDRTSSA